MVSMVNILIKLSLRVSKEDFLKGIIRELKIFSIFYY